MSPSVEAIFFFFYYQQNFSYFYKYLQFQNEKLNQKEFFGSAISFFKKYTLNCILIVIHIKAKYYCMLNIRLLSWRIQVLLWLTYKDTFILSQIKELRRSAVIFQLSVTGTVLLYSNYQSQFSM